MQSPFFLSIYMPALHVHYVMCHVQSNLWAGTSPHSSIHLLLTHFISLGFRIMGALPASQVRAGQRKVGQGRAGQGRGCDNNIVGDSRQRRLTCDEIHRFVSLPASRGWPSMSFARISSFTLSEIVWVWWPLCPSITGDEVASDHDQNVSIIPTESIFSCAAAQRVCSIQKNLPSRLRFLSVCHFGLTSTSFPLLSTARHRERQTLRKLNKLQKMYSIRQVKRTYVAARCSTLLLSFNANRRLASDRRWHADFCMPIYLAQESNCVRDPWYLDVAIGALIHGRIILWAVSITVD